MKLFYKKIILILFLLITYQSFCTASSIRGLDGFEWQAIDAIKNARNHSNMGNIYFKEESYYMALKEYQIAYNLTYDMNASSTYLYNIARCFIKLNNYNAAKSALEGAIEKNCLNMTYYKTLVDVYIKLNIHKRELKRCLNDNSNPYNRIIAGLIFLQTGDTYAAKGIFDEFVTVNPDMIITDDIKNILNKL